jgi:hypothetical protein
MSQVVGQVAAIELRCLLVADAFIPVRQRQRLIGDVARLVEDQQLAVEFQVRMNEIVQGRFGRNPDTLEISDATREALQMIQDAQHGKFRSRIVRDDL